jgi:hypothetical protein
MGYSRKCGNKEVKSVKALSRVVISDMTKQINQMQKLSKLFSVLTIFIGAVLLIDMIAVEDEPGALPLILLIIGVIWFVITKYQIKKRAQRET